MGRQDRFADEFKQDAVAHVVERGHPVSEVAERLGISTKPLYTWKVLFSKPATVRNRQADLTTELRRVKKKLLRVTEPRRKHTNNDMLSPIDLKTRQQKLKKADF